MREAFEAVFCEALSSRQVGALKGQLYADRVEGLRRIVSCRIAAMDGYFIGLSELLKDSPGRCETLINHWAPVFYLSHLLNVHLTPAFREMATSNLLVPLLFERLSSGASPLAGVSFVSPTDEEGAVHVLGQGRRVRVRGLAVPRARLSWRCDRQSVTVELADTGDHRTQIPLPLLGDGEATSVELIPCPRIEGWQVPLVRDARAVLFVGDQPVMKDSLSEGKRGPEQSLLPVSESLAQAHSLLQKIWPEVLPWVGLLVPCFVEQESNDENLRSSGSVGSGCPIYLSRVADPFLHAEDLVHELQHHRFLLLPLDRYFHRWSDRDPSFISPYRADPRPLSGLHLGLHAFLAVNELRLRARRWTGCDDHAIGKLLETHRRNVFAFRTLMAHERFSVEGEVFYAKIWRILRDHHDAIEPLAGPSVVHEVEAALGKNRSRVMSQGAMTNVNVSFTGSMIDAS